MSFPRKHCKLLILFFTLVTLIEATNYCDPKLCQGSTHIGCDPKSKNWSKKCKSPKMMPITAQHKKIILDEHNAKRNLVAGGKTKLKPACRMATMQWDEELASLAALNVKQCEMKHDACHNTKTFPYSGQNLAIQWSSATMNFNTLLKKFVQMWYDEIKYARMSDISKLSGSISKIGHFTCMVGERNIRVGCAVSYSKNRGMNNYLFACNYATTNMMQQPVYESCNKPASKCQTGKNPAYKNLCSVSEKYDSNRNGKRNKKSSSKAGRNSYGNSPFDIYNYDPGRTGKIYIRSYQTGNFPGEYKFYQQSFYV